jgi:hypothetical protein
MPPDPANATPAASRIGSDDRVAPWADLMRISSSISHGARRLGSYHRGIRRGLRQGLRVRRGHPGSQPRRRAGRLCPATVELPASPKVLWGVPAGLEPATRGLGIGPRRSTETSPVRWTGPCAHGRPRSPFRASECRSVDSQEIPDRSIQGQRSMWSLSSRRCLRPARLGHPRRLPRR